MSYWSWDPALDTGVEVIDNQHKRIVGFINTLHDNLESNENEKVGEVLNDLMEYLLTHFAFEEELMVQSGYPIDEGHKAAHDEFAAVINGYQSRHDAGEDIAKELMEELTHWFQSHIQFDDSDYVPAVKKAFNPNWVQSAVNRLFG